LLCNRKHNRLRSLGCTFQGSRATPDSVLPHRRGWAGSKSLKENKMRSLYRRAASATHAFSACILIVILAAATGCGTSSAGPEPPAPPPSSGSVPQFGHVVLVLEENHGYSEVIGN